ncbi:hypothetical protein DL770_000006 [Monosporascus sp. CRB-9-2]|nr:hypothetical protein DL770_000006 [Monosporascus sp. CRB-9-2]
MALPSNVHLSQHPCLRAKLSRLRSKQTHVREAKVLVHEIATILGCEALASTLKAVDGPKDETPIGFEYTTTTTQPKEVSLVPILRSGLGMVEGRSFQTRTHLAHTPLPSRSTARKPPSAPSPPNTEQIDPQILTHAPARAAIQALLPEPVPVHHLGLYREPSTLEPVEYYNNLPNHIGSSGAAQSPSKLAVILDPVIATGGTCAAAIQTLREWGARRVLVLSVIGASDGVARAADEWPEGVDVWLAGIDPELTATGMVKPGLGDIGDRLFLTVGK